MKNYFLGNKPLSFVLWLTYILPYAVFSALIYALYKFNFAPQLPSVVYEAYLLLAITLYIFSVYVAGFVLIKTVAKADISKIFKWALVAFAIVMMLSAPLKFVLTLF